MNKLYKFSYSIENVWFFMYFFLSYIYARTLYLKWIKKSVYLDGSGIDGLRVPMSPTVFHEELSGNHRIL